MMMMMMTMMMMFRMIVHLEMITVKDGEGNDDINRKDKHDDNAIKNLVGVMHYIYSPL